LLFASSSSVYGESNKFPLKENFSTDQTNSLYGSTKKINEVMAATYSSLYKFNCIGLRFFTVYGPYGRPDMSLYKFVKSITKGKKVQLFNHGNHVRDFTYIDDVIESISRLIRYKIKKSDELFEIFNIGSNNPKTLLEYVQTIEKLLKKKANIEKKPFQKGDILKTHASVNKLYKKINYKPSTKMVVGIQSYIDWYKSYYS
jgi:Nucleoside-diphosphate-sugar epimerases